MTYELKNKVVLITGAATGIGSAVVRLLLKEGTKHVAVLDVAEDAGIALQNELYSLYGDNKVKFYKCDVTNDDQLFGAFKATADEYGYIDVVINNAGIMNDSLRLYKKEIEVNVTALVTGTLKALELMRKDEGGKGGTVINISSIAGLHQLPLMPIYFATKSAVIQFSNCIGLEGYYSRTGVRVLTIFFGPTKTELMSANCLGSYDKQIDGGLAEAIRYKPIQSIESAAKGVVEAFKQGKSASTWLVQSDKPALDITETVTKAYCLMEERME